jgi:hypothetical protein
MNLVRERQEIDKANRYALDEMEQRKLELQNEERRLIEEIKISKENLGLKKNWQKRKQECKLAHDLRTRVSQWSWVTKVRVTTCKSTLNGFCNCKQNS